MNKASLASMALVGILSATQLGAQAGSPNMTPGGVTRVTLIRINPGHGDMFWEDVRKNTRVLWDEYKKRGIMVDYSIATKVTTDDPNDWNVAFTQTYRNWAALDNLGVRTDSVTVPHYGSAAARTAAGTARLQHSTTVSSFLIRNQTVNPWRAP